MIGSDLQNNCFKGRYMKIFGKAISFGLLFVGILLSYHFTNESKQTIFLIGDSTMSDKPLDDNPEHGWGQVFPNWFTSEVKIENHAKNGRSTKSFFNQGLWKVVYDKLKPGDYVFIQFGHNDSKITDTSRYAEPHTTYKQFLIRYVNDTRSKGAIPILITPVNRRKFDDEGKFVDQHGDYPGVVREVANEMNVPLIDLHAKSLKYFSELGSEQTKKLFLVGVPPNTYKAMPKGNGDNTHFTHYGAVKVAEMVVEGIRELHLPIEKMLKPNFQISMIGQGKTVGLDYFYNHEFKKDKEGKSVQYHYIWEDKENSGYSELGNLIENFSASIYEVKNAPTQNDLKNLSIYMIVDPDTPAENPEPNYIADSSITEIEKWVSSGGVLVLLTNDKGNCEFEHLNRLSEKFGIHFNEDSRNRVIGNNFNMGKFDNLPLHPIFDGVKKIYLKEISILKLNSSAKAILTDGNDVIMASSKIGKGFVFAVGDPWLYNEYIDNRKLPTDFENYKAAENLIRWLLGKSQIAKNRLIKS